MHDETEVPIWFFIGCLLLIYGVLIFGAGLYALVFPPPEEQRVALYSLHADVWWGAFMAAVGSFYCLRYHPYKAKAPAGIEALE
ncbi:hypothetical protein OJF2_58770 [Aquisphaera giovannonii]|uniref:Uncharacterized protein n=1 Tax=Aquisphaera giovannonii TaxID=406548 RepID=A0A5B9WA21_9BACT|nr:hypothetical protein [Aquisphaera giovannonii]QEH37287.1 hypothetical protein OJF2_58770 [Aquisphaera giovannonii]